MRRYYRGVLYSQEKNIGCHPLQMKLLTNTNYLQTICCAIEEHILNTLCLKRIEDI